jgi:hypothetical protein
MLYELIHFIYQVPFRFFACTVKFFTPLQLHDFNAGGVYNGILLTIEHQTRNVI